MMPSGEVRGDLDAGRVEEYGAIGRACRQARPVEPVELGLPLFANWAQKQTDIRHAPIDGK